MFVEVDLVVGVCGFDSFLFLDIWTNVTLESVAFVHSRFDSFRSLRRWWWYLSLDEDILDVSRPLVSCHGGGGGRLMPCVVFVSKFCDVSS